jgi:hypothetical protein
MQRFLDIFISINCSKCFRRFPRPSSGAQNCTYSFRYCQINTAAIVDEISSSSISSTISGTAGIGLTISDVVCTVLCCYCGWDGTHGVLSHLHEIELMEFYLIQNSSNCWYWFDNIWRCMYSFVLLLWMRWNSWSSISPTWDWTHGVLSHPQ